MYKGEPPGDVKPQYRGSGTREIETVSVVKKTKKNHLDVLEGHFPTMKR